MFNLDATYHTIIGRADCHVFIIFKNIDARIIVLFSFIAALFEHRPLRDIVARLVSVFITAAFPTRVCNVVF